MSTSTRSFRQFYLVANAREPQIPLQAVEADFTVTTSSDWIVASGEGTFRASLDPAASPEELARADEDAIAHLQERMKPCPISRNLPVSVSNTIRVTLPR